MRFIEFLMNEDIDSEMNLMNTSQRKMADIPNEIYPKDQINLSKKDISNLKKHARNSSAKKFSSFKVKSDRPLPKTMFGDIKMVKLARSHEVNSGTPSDLIHYEMKATQPKVKSNREMLLKLSRKKAEEINARKTRK